MGKVRDSQSDSGHEGGSHRFAEGVTFGPSSVDHAGLKMTGLRKKVFPIEVKYRAEETEEKRNWPGQGGV